MRLVVFDVGQGDSILIDTPRGHHILVDGSGSDYVLSLLKIFLAVPKEFTLVIATHNHIDHIGGLIDVLNHYNIKEIWITGAKHRTNTFNRWQQALTKEKQQGSKIEKVKAGYEYKIDQLTIKVLYPIENMIDVTPDHQHDANIVTKFDYGTSSFLLTGDLEEENEQELIDRYGVNLGTQVLKVSHHGSANTSSNKFLELVDPEIALISVGKDNRYNHPHQATLERLQQQGARIFRTDQDGTIVVKSNGEKIWITTNTGNKNLGTK